MSTMLLFNLIDTEWCFFLRRLKGGGGAFSSMVFVASMTQDDYNENIAGSLLLGCQQNQVRFVSVGAGPIKSSNDTSII